MIKENFSLFFLFLKIVDHVKKFVKILELKIYR